MFDPTIYLAFFQQALHGIIATGPEGCKVGGERGKTGPSCLLGEPSFFSPPMPSSWSMWLLLHASPATPGVNFLRIKITLRGREGAEGKLTPPNPALLATLSACHPNGQAKHNLHHQGCAHRLQITFQCNLVYTLPAFSMQDRVPGQRIQGEALWIHNGITI